MSRNLQLGIHPDADKISVFVEGAATAREQEQMLAHLADCAECRKAVFLMQPHEEPQRVVATPERRWMWRWLVPVGLPAAALACGLIAVFVYIRPHDASKTPQQVASVRPPEADRTGTTTGPIGDVQQGVPTVSADRAASISSEQAARSGGRKNDLATKVATHVPRQMPQAASGLNLSASNTEQAVASVAPQKTGIAPSTIGGPVAGVATVSDGITSKTVSQLPLNGRDVFDLQQLQPADTEGAESQNGLASKNNLPELQIERAGGKDETLAGISGSITDRSGAVIAGVAVTVRDAAGKTRQTTTGADGSFHLTDLPSGRYELTAAATGFKTSKQPIELKSSELAMLQPVLDIGSVSEQVTVEAGTPLIQTESASLGQVVTAMPGVHLGGALASVLPVQATVAHGKRVLSLDEAGNLFLSRNKGKKWKKIKPQWAGKAIRIELTSASVSQVAQKPNGETSSAPNDAAVFLLTTDGGTVWSSKDGAHWHQVTSPR